MPQITGALSINNGAATPVAKTFSPEKISPGDSTFTERSASTSNGFTRFGVAFSPASAARPTNRIDVALSLPVLTNVNGVNKVGYTGLFKGYFVVPDTMTAAERADLHAFVVNALNTAQVRAVIKDLDPMY